MYRVIGEDQNEYGPFDVPTLHQLIAEGRVHARTVLIDMNDGQRHPAHTVAPLQPVLSRYAARPPVAHAQATPLRFRGSPPARAGARGNAAAVACAAALLAFGGLMGLSALTTCRRAATATVVYPVETPSPVYAAPVAVPAPPLPPPPPFDAATDPLPSPAGRNDPFAPVPSLIPSSSRLVGRMVELKRDGAGRLDVALSREVFDAYRAGDVVTVRELRTSESIVPLRPGTPAQCFTWDGPRRAFQVRIAAGPRQGVVGWVAEDSVLPLP